MRHNSFFNARFERIREAHREMTEEFGRMAGIFRWVIGLEMTMKEKAKDEEEMIGRLVGNAIGGMDQLNKRVVEKVTAELNRCLTLMEFNESDRRKGGERIEKVIRERRMSLKE